MEQKVFEVNYRIIHAGKEMKFRTKIPAEEEADAFVKVKRFIDRKMDIKVDSIEELVSEKDREYVEGVIDAFAQVARQQERMKKLHQSIATTGLTPEIVYELKRFSQMLGQLADQFEKEL